MKKVNLHHIFNPTSIAVIGASTKPGRVGSAVFQNLLESGFNGPVYPVNPKADHIMSVRAYGDLAEIPGAVDLAVICVPAKVVPKVVEACAAKGVKAILLITAGFKEIGAEGAQAELAIMETVQKHEIPLVGPNCLGIINTEVEVSLNASFALGRPPKGNVALISQSGAVGVAALEYVKSNNVGLSKFVSIGNKAVLDESDFISFLAKDSDTNVITVYVEDIKRPKAFRQACMEAFANQTPVVVIRTGRSKRGGMAASSHTGALSGSDTAYDALFNQSGAIRVENLNELFELAKAMSVHKKMTSPNLIVLTNAGGMGIIAADAAERNQLNIMDLSEETKQELRKVLPETAAINNPIDIIGDADAERYQKALEILAKEKNVGAILVSGTPQLMTDLDAIAEKLVDSAKQNPNLYFSANLMALHPNPTFNELLGQNDIPNFSFPELNVRTLGQKWRYHQLAKLPKHEYPTFEVNREKAKQIIAKAKAARRKNLTEVEAYGVFEAFDLPILPHVLVKDTKEALKEADNIGFPMVLKVVSPDILHKFDVGGVVLDIPDKVALEKAMKKMKQDIAQKAPEAKVEGFLLQQFLKTPGVEVIMGATQVEGFGPLIMFGLGGTYVELFKDVSFRLTPLAEIDAKRMIEEVNGSKMLNGFRGQPKHDLAPIVASLLKLNQLVSDFPEIKEVEVNPLRSIPNGEGLHALDAVILLND